MGGTGCGKNWVLLWCAWPCSVKLNPVTCWWVGLRSLPVSLACGNLVLGSVGSMVGLMAAFKGNYAKGDLPGPLLPPSLWAGPVNSCLHRRPTLQPKQGVLVQSPGGSLLLCSGSWCMSNFVCVRQDWSFCFPPVLWKSYNQILLGCTDNSLGSLSLFVGSPGWEIWCGIQNLHNSGRTSLVLLFSSLWVTHPAGMGFDFYCDCAPPTNFLRLFCLWMWGIFFLVGSSILLLMVFQHLVAILVLLQKEMSQSPEFFLIRFHSVGMIDSLATWLNSISSGPLISRGWMTEQVQSSNHVLGLFCLLINCFWLCWVFTFFFFFLFVVNFCAGFL